MSDGAARWGDLAPRIMTAAIMLTVGVIEVWLGGWAFVLGVALLAAVMTWELARMLALAGHRLDVDSGWHALGRHQVPPRASG